jgi:hypothetical protein
MPLNMALLSGEDTETAAVSLPSLQGTVTGGPSWGTPMVWRSSPNQSALVAIFSLAICCLLLVLLLV